MIHRISSSLPTFKTVEFKSGLNILLADRRKSSSTKDTRNSAGKSSMIEIINFLTGARVDKRSIFRHPELVNHTFSMEFDVGGAHLRVSRSGSDASHVQISRLVGDAGLWPDDLFSNDAVATLGNRNWTDLLGEAMFKLRAIENGPIPNFRPKFRSLFSYFVRRDSSKGFLDPSRHSEKQAEWDQQVMLSYLLGLDWTIAREWELVREREAGLKQLRKTGGAEFKDVIGSAAALRAELAAAEERVTETREATNNFRVLPTYRDREQEAEEATRLIGDLRNQNQADRALVAELERSLEAEAPPPVVDVQEVYAEAQVLLPEIALRRFEEVRQFHESVVANRRRYLQAELEGARERVRTRENQATNLDRRRSEIYRLLTSHHALDQLTALQVELARAEAQVTILRKRFEAAQQIESTKATLDIERRKLQLRLQQDYDEREPALRRSIVTLRAIVEELYGSRPGRLLIQPTTKGPEFDVKIEGDRGKGIRNMEIFSFDVMLTRIAHARGMGPGFLVHDSHLFDGVDQRQRGTALMVGKRAAMATDGQYIVTMNSDEFPSQSERPADFDADADILPVRITDEENGGLFGFRFD